MDREKVIKAFEICDNNEDGIVCKNCPYKEDEWNGAWEDETGKTCFQTLHADVLALLKEQEAVKPRISCVEQRCGNCNKVIEMDGWKVCPWCGKPILWEAVGRSVK